MASDKKVRFIRKNGRVIPIRSGGKKSFTTYEKTKQQKVMELGGGIVGAAALAKKAVGSSKSFTLAAAATVGGFALGRAAAGFVGKQVYGLKPVKKKRGTSAY